MDHQISSLFMMTCHVCYLIKKEIITFLESVLRYPWECRGHSDHGIGVEIRGPPVGVGSLIPPLWGSWRWNSISRLIWQASSPTDSSCWPHDSCVNKTHSWQDVDLCHMPSFPHYNGFFSSELSHLASSAKKIYTNYPHAEQFPWLLMSVFQNVSQGHLYSSKIPTRKQRKSLLH